MLNSPQKAQIAFIGIGLMGRPMAARLLSAEYPLTVWNRSSGKTQDLLSLGAHNANTPSEAIVNADVVILMLADGASVTEVLFDSATLAALRPGVVVIDMSSIPPALAQAHSAKLLARQILHLDAPVSGGTRGAADATLAIMVGGPPDTFQSVRAVLEAMGRPTLIGPSGTGQLAKLANQVIVAVTIGAVAEALLLAAAGGADPAKVREALTGGFADSMVLKQHGQRMLDRAWVPGGLLQTQVKDLRTILAVASDLHLQLPLSRQIAGLFESSLAAGLGQYDHSALLLELERRHPGARVGTKPDQHPK